MMNRSAGDVARFLADLLLFLLLPLETPDPTPFSFGFGWEVESALGTLIPACSAVRGERGEESR